MKAKTKNVALTLASGGPRGFAYIGAIEELESRGYKITSIAGCSAGSLVGGIYAAGHLAEFKEWLCQLDDKKVMQMLDLSLSKRYLVKGDKIKDQIKEVVPEVNIEDLPIPYVAVASDLYTGEEVLFHEGPLFNAIRASMSIPSLFRPVKYGHRTLVDGGLVNTFPLNRVQRSGNDISIGFNVNQIDADAINAFLIGQAAEQAEQQKLDQNTLATIEQIVKTDKTMSTLDKVRAIGSQSSELLKRKVDKVSESFKDQKGEGLGTLPDEVDDNYYSIISRSFSLCNHALSKMAIEICKPDVLVEMPVDAYDTIASYTKAGEIAETGRMLMARALDEYESR